MLLPTLFLLFVAGFKCLFLLSQLPLFALLSLLSYASNQTVESATIGSGFPSARLLGVWSKVVFGLRKHNLASTPNNVFRGSPF